MIYYNFKYYNYKLIILGLTSLFQEWPDDILAEVLKMRFSDLNPLTNYNEKYYKLIHASVLTKRNLTKKLNDKIELTDEQKVYYHIMLL